MNTLMSKTGLPEEILFYCKDCHKVSPVHRLGRRYVYTCAVCGTKNVAFGSVRSISRYFRVSEEELNGGAVAAPGTAAETAETKDSGKAALGSTTPDAAAPGATATSSDAEESNA